MNSQPWLLSVFKGYFTTGLLLIYFLTLYTDTSVVTFLYSYLLTILLAPLLVVSVCHVYFTWNSEL